MRSRRKSKFMGIVPHDIKEIRKQVYLVKKVIAENSTDTQFYFPEFVETGPIYKVLRAQVMKLRTALLKRIEQGFENWLVMFDNGQNLRFVNPNWVCFDNYCNTNNPYHILIKTDLKNAIPIFKLLSDCFHYITIDWNAFYNEETIPILMSMLVKNGVFARECFQHDGNIIFPREYTHGTGYVQKDQWCLPIHKIQPKHVKTNPHHELHSIIIFYRTYPQYINKIILDQIGWYIQLDPICLFYYMTYQFVHKKVSTLQAFFPYINRTPEMLQDELDLCETPEEKHNITSMPIHICPLDEHVAHFDLIKINFTQLMEVYSMHYELYINQWRPPLYKESDITYEDTQSNLSLYCILLHK